MNQFSYKHSGFSPYLVLYFLVVSTALVGCQPQVKDEDLGEVELIPVNSIHPDNENMDITDGIDKTEQAELTEPDLNNSTNKNATSKKQRTQETLPKTSGSDKKLIIKQEQPQQTPIQKPKTHLPSITSDFSANNQSLDFKADKSNNPDSIARGVQVTKVAYKSESGQSVSTTFKTSAVGTLAAEITLPSGQKVQLTAPQAGGNNPIYESSDGSIVLVSHGGGGSMDLIVNGEPMEFTAITADAQVYNQD